MRVSLVIPGRNVAGTIRSCLEAVVPLLGQYGLKEIIFVDDGSIDDTEKIVQHYPIRLIKIEGKGPGAARNAGWQAAKGDLVWFLDADCIAEPTALSILLEYMKDPQIAGVGGSYGNARKDSFLACLIHEEIVERHRRMPSRVNFLASFNVLYRTEILRRVGGFDERYLKAQDAELSYRIREAGGRLVFDRRSIVKHYHPVKLSSYLRTQCAHGYWRIFLYALHPRKMMGDSYSNVADHLQPILAITIMLALPMYSFTPFLWSALIALLLLVIIQLPMTFSLAKRCGNSYLLFAPMNFSRSFARGIGMIAGIFSCFFKSLKEQ